MCQRRLWVREGGNALAALAALVTTLCCLGFPALVGLLSALGPDSCSLTAIWSRFWPQRSCLACSSRDSTCGGIVSLGPSCSRWWQPEACFSPSTAPDCSPMRRAAIAWQMAWLPHPPGVLSWSMQPSSSRLRAQVWDLRLFRRCAPKTAPVPTYFAPALSERRKEGV